MTLQSQFLYSGEVSNLRLVLEESTFRGRWQCFCNGVEITEFHPSEEYDCRNHAADLTPFVRTGSTPTLNSIRFVLSGENCTMTEMPYLYGQFKAQFRYAGKSLPFLEGFSGKLRPDSLQLWLEYGYGTYSGTADYLTTFETPHDGEYLLDLGRVDDLAEIFLDGVSLGEKITPPYAWKTGFLKQGAHELRITVCNGPGNRDRLADLPSGLYGPVLLGRYYPCKSFQTR